MAIATINIENIVASASIDCEINLKNLVHNLEGAKYDPELFPGLVLHLSDPKVTTLIFSSGKMVSTGAKNIEDLGKGLKKVLKELIRTGIKAHSNTDITIQNIVASGDLNSDLNLNAVAISLGLENIEYEPEQFPGLVYRIANPKVVLLLFTSGKIVITGAKTIEDVTAAMKEIVKALEGVCLI